MLGGNNDNPLPHDSQFQYQSNTSLNQLHLLETRDQLAKGVKDIKQRHVRYFVAALEKDVWKKLQEKDQEI
ncbi:unnamed protein product [Eruca vesicaria subsp. sativa]|uniref:Uncharacterized protein n=1 Tax=Eruca vesicaria subsp. sativa TaxID=29727 RepID=A0ABC8KS61_ERUVS|nr:unnamed protein product [Eruca vesicaria subsp. sativa]